MAGSMSRADLVADLKAGLQDAANVFTAAADGDFIRHLDASALDMGRVRPRTLLGEVTLVADQAAYAAPAGMLMFKSALWGMKRPLPWEKTWPGRLPTGRAVEGATARELHLVPPPDATQISVLGASYKFYYYAGHAISDTAASTTVQPGDRALLLLRAQAEAMKELAMRNSAKPVALRDGISGSPRNGTPSYLFEALMQQFDQQAVL